jgi:hypothetical protein
VVLMNGSGRRDDEVAASMRLGGLRSSARERGKAAKFSL